MIIRRSRLYIYDLGLIYRIEHRRSHGDVVVDMTRYRSVLPGGWNDAAVGQERGGRSGGGGTDPG